MRKPAFLQKEPLSRLCVAFLLTSGVVLPLLLALDLGNYAVGSLALALVTLASLTVLGVTRKSRRLMRILLGVTVLIQFFLPGAGLLGGWLEAFKALALYFSSYTVVLPLYGAQVASLLTVLAASLSYVFSKRGVGFLPAAFIVVLVMFGLWSLGKGNLFWYAAPALIALLLQMSQTAHEKINLLHVLPMAIGTVMLAFLLLPGGRITLEPLAKAATDLKQMITDYLFFTEPRNVFTLGSYGYYPMGNGQLGGPAEPSEYPVMMVKTDQKILMRAVAKDMYSGRSFTDTSSAKRYLYINPRWQAQRRKVFMELLPSDAIRKASHLLDEKAVAVQMQNRAASTVFTPLYVRSMNMGNDMVAYFNDASELFITRDLNLGDRYTIYAPILEGGEDGLEALVNASVKKDEYYQDIYSTYTQLPDHMEQKVFDDVSNIVSAETTPYGKAMAIMRHLQKYYRYTLTPDTPPQNQDFVTYFLYMGKKGYCTYYASAMTVMCRMANLPARYVEGFLAQPSSDGFAYVTGKDAHAWTEVYFEGFGWIPFDPTPLQQSGSDTPPQSDSSTEPSPEPSPEDQPTPTPDPNQPDDQPTPEPNPSEEPQPHQNEDTEDAPPEDNPFEFQWALLLALAALVALIVRVALRKPDRVVMRMPTEKDKIFIYGAAVQRLLAYAKRTPKNGETPLAFAKRLDSVRVFPTPILPLWRIMALSNYSRMEPAHEQTLRAKEIFRQVYKGSHPLRKLRFLLAAAFDPHFYRVLDTPMPHRNPPKPPAIKLPKSAQKANPGAYAAHPVRNQTGAKRPLTAENSEPENPAGIPGNTGKHGPVQPDSNINGNEHSRRRSGRGNLAGSAGRRKPDSRRVSPPAGEPPENPTEKRGDRPAKPERRAQDQNPSAINPIHGPGENIPEQNAIPGPVKNPPMSPARKERPTDTPREIKSDRQG